MCSQKQLSCKMTVKKHGEMPCKIPVEEFIFSKITKNHFQDFFSMTWENIHLVNFRNTFF